MVCIYVYLALHLKDTTAYSKLGVVVHACNLSMWEVETEGSEIKSFSASSRSAQSVQDFFLKQTKKNGENKSPRTDPRSHCLLQRLKQFHLHYS